MTEHLDISESISKAAYAFYRKKGSKDGTTGGRYFDSAFAQDRVVSNISSNFWGNHGESWCRIQGHFDDSFGCKPLNLYVKRNDSFFQN